MGVGVGVGVGKRGGGGEGGLCRVATSDIHNTDIIHHYRRRGGGLTPQTSHVR